MEFSEEKWKQVLEYLQEKFDATMDIKSVLFILGLRELGKVGQDFSKEAKMDLMNVGFCKITSLSGYFQILEKDKDGWPVWKQIKPLPKMSTKEQELFIKTHVINYFEAEALI